MTLPTNSDALQNSQSELEFWEGVFGKSTNAKGNAEGYITYADFTKRLEAYVTTRVKETLTSLRNKTSQNPQWPKDYKFARSEYDIAITEIIEALTTTTNGKEE